MLHIFIGILGGAAVGFAIGYFGKCAGGTCPLSGNPVISTIVGAVFGLLIATGK